MKGEKAALALLYPPRSLREKSGSVSISVVGVRSPLSGGEIELWGASKQTRGKCLSVRLLCRDKYHGIVVVQVCDVVCGVCGVLLSVTQSEPDSAVGFCE